MQLAYAFPSNGAEFGPEGRLFLLAGDYDAICSPEFPFTYPLIAFVGKLWLSPEDCKQRHRLVVQLSGPEGAESRDATTEFGPVERPASSSRQAGFGFVIHMPNLRFTAPGEYAFRIIVDGRELGAIPLRLDLDSGASIRRRAP